MYDPNRNLDLALVAAIIILCAIAWVVSGCTNSATPAWSSEYDKTWEIVCNCWDADPEKPIVRIKSGCYGDYPQRFATGPDTAAYGMLVGETVYVCPDLGALRHEFSHYVSLKVRGVPGANGEGVCWL